MKTKFLVLLSIISLLFAAFASPVSVAYARDAARAGALLSTQVISTSSSSTSDSSTTTSISTSSASYSPQPSDVYLIRDTVFLDLANSRLNVSSSYPVQVSATLKGYLPDPCHILRAVVGSSNATSSINISVYSLVKAGTACITVLQPFTVTVPLGSFTSGHYTVYVNSAKLGEFSVISVTSSTSVK